MEARGRRTSQPYVRARQSSKENKISIKVWDNIVYSQEIKEQLKWKERGSELEIYSPAKINLTLSVGAKRPDGYHIFKSLMSTVTLYDKLRMRKYNSPEIKLTCNIDSLPDGFENLAYRAASLLMGSRGIEKGIEIALTKKIPIQSGLGGGSSNAAAVLIALNELWELELSEKELLTLAEMLGSDVPFFIKGPLAICAGRGELVSPIDFSWDFWAILIKPNISLPTKEVYHYHRVSESKDFNLTDHIVRKLPRSKPSEIAESLYNDLEPAAFRISPELGLLRKELELFFNRPVRLTGSGSAMFVLFDREDETIEESRRFVDNYPELNAWVVRNNIW